MPRIVAALGIILLTGCQYMPAQRPVVESRPEVPVAKESIENAEAARLSDLLGYYRRTDGLGDEQIRQRLQLLSGDVQPGRCNAARLKSAMLFTRLASDTDDRGDRDLLAPCSENPLVRHSIQGRLALLLQDMLALRLRHANGEGELRRLSDELSAAREENQELRKQLEGLKAIENSIRKRDRRLPAED